MPDDVKKELYFNEKQKIWAKEKLSEASSRQEIFVPVNDLKSELLKSFTVTYHHKVLALFQFFKENPSFFKMSMTGEAVIRGERIISSSVYRLLDFLFHNRRKVLQTPLGTEELMEALATSNFPIQNMVNQRLKSVLKTLRVSVDHELDASNDGFETYEPLSKHPKLYKETEDQDFSEDELRTLTNS